MRAHAGIADLTALVKIEINGSDAKSFLNGIQSYKLP
jgi:dimethylglycine dehydrogenase